MEPWYQRSLISLLTIGLTVAAFAQDEPRPDLPAPNAVALPLNTPTMLTGKERLGRKWMDEQHIDN